MPRSLVAALAKRQAALPQEDKLNAFIRKCRVEGAQAQNVGTLAANTSPFNYTGFPAVSLPCGKSGGLRIGLQFVAPHFRADLLVRVAHAYQRSVDWESFFPTRETPLAAAARP